MPKWEICKIQSRRNYINRYALCNVSLNQHNSRAILALRMVKHTYLEYSGTSQVSLAFSICWFCIYICVHSFYLTSSASKTNLCIVYAPSCGQSSHLQLFKHIWKLGNTDFSTFKKSGFKVGSSLLLIFSFHKTSNFSLKLHHNKGKIWYIHILYFIFSISIFYFLGTWHCYITYIVGRTMENRILYYFHGLSLYSFQWLRRI